MNNLEYSLGLDIAGFKASARQAQEQSEEIKRGFRGFKDVLTAGGVGTVVIGFFRDVIEYAKNAKAGVDENIDAVKRFGSGMTSLKETVLGWGAAFLGVLNRSGENLADMFNYVRMGSAEFEKMAASERAAAEAEQRAAEFREKYGKRYEALAITEANIAKEREALRLKSLTVQERFNDLTNQYLKLSAEAIKIEGNDDESRLKKKEAAALAAKKYLEVIAATNEVLSENEKRETAAGKAVEKALEEHERKANAVADVRSKIADFSRTEMELGEQINDLKSTESALTQSISESEEGTAEWIEKNNKLLSVRVALRTLEEKKAEEQKKREAGEAKAAEMSEKARTGIFFALTNGGISGKELMDASPAELLEILRRRRSELANLPYEYNFGGGKSFSQLRLENEATRINSELAFRRDLKRDYDFGGEALARRNFRGDPQVFDEVLARMTGQWGKQDETNDLIEETNRKLDQLGSRLTAGLSEAVSVNRVRKQP